MTDVNTTTVLPDIFQGEGKWFKFTYTRDGVVLDLTGATFSFQVRKNTEEAVVFEGVTFDETQEALGIVRVNLPATTTALMDVDTYYGQMEVILTADTDVDKSQFVKFKIKKPIVVTEVSP